MADSKKTVPQIAVNDIGTKEDFINAVDSTIKNFDDGDLVTGVVVRIDRDEVLLDIGYKTEGVIPSRELSIKKDVDPDDVVETGDSIEALVITKEDKEGRLLLSKKRAQYERAWGEVEKIKEADGVVEGTVIEAVKGGLIVDIGLRGFLPASLVEMRRVRDLTPYIGQTIQAKILELIKEIQAESNFAVIYITHDLGVVAKVADYVDVMYAGRIIEKGNIDEIFYDPRQPVMRLRRATRLH